MRPIPKLPVLALAATAGCGADPIVGDWDGVYLQTTGYEPITFPHRDVVTTDQGVYDYFLDLTASFVKGGSGVLTFHERFEKEGQVAYENLGRYAAIQGDRLSRGRWVYQVPSYDELILECTAERDTMSCIGDDVLATEYVMDFERAEE